MIKRDAIILVLAILSGAAAFVMVFNFLNEAAQPKREFVLAKVAIAQGKEITREDLALSKPLKNTDAKNLFLQLDDVVGRNALEEIPKGTLIDRSKLKLKEPPLPVLPKKSALPIPEGMRALTIGAGDIIGMPDLLEIGNYIDVLGTVLTSTGLRELKTILYGAQVISMEGGEGVPIRSITLAVNPNETPVLIESMGQGKIRVIVRPDQGERYLYQSEIGSMEVIRGTSREKKITT